ncbi:MAG: hypothetical protein HC888_01725 [Candidatus Competibacteraceae bacterium]|nr:hypothetical protein [Candidatus Competibacteraceae bacterium]
MVAWGGNRDSLLSKEEATNKVAKVLRMELPDEKGPVIMGKKKTQVDDLDIQAGEVDFSKDDDGAEEAGVPAGKKGKLQLKSRKVSSAQSVNNSKNNKAVSKSLKPVGRQRQEPNPNDDILIDSGSDASRDTIGFVDQEEVTARMAKHPRLSNNGEIDLV